jgi:hypothetical protein
MRCGLVHTIASTVDAPSAAGAGETSNNTKNPRTFSLSFISFFLSSSLIAHGVVLFNNEIHARQAA